MKKTVLILALVCAFTHFCFAQSVTSQSHKQSATVSTSITTTGAQTGIVTTGYSVLRFTMSGTYSGANLRVDGSVDGTNYTFTGLPFYADSTCARSTSTGALTNTTETYYAVVTGFTKVQINCTAISGGTLALTTTLESSPGFGCVALQALPLPLGAATSARQSDGSQKTQVVDGSGNVIGATSNALDINIKSGNPTTIAATQSTASNLKVEPSGNVASGSADSGNPVKVGGKYNSTLPTFTDGQRGDMQLNSRGALLVDLQTRLDWTNDSVTVKTDQTTHGTTDLVAADVTKLGGTAIDTNSGNKSAGTQRVVIATDQPNLTTPLNENVAQINGVTPLMGAGNAGTGSPRVTIATDQAAIPTHGHGATGSAVPANATYAGARSGANLTGIIQGDTSVPINISTATTTQVIALSGSTKIYITHYHFESAGTTNFKFVYGTGTNCGTGTTDLHPNFALVAQSGATGGGGLGPVLIVPSGQALCVTNSAAVQVSGWLTYTQF